MAQDTVTVIVPEGAIPNEDLLSELVEIGMRLIAEKHGEKEDWPEKYGVVFDNEIFTMHPFCWCEKDECEYCQEEDRSPNFLHKKTGLKVHWYKYIGRSMEISGDVTVNDVLDIIKECLRE